MPFLHAHGAKRLYERASAFRNSGRNSVAAEERMPTDLDRRGLTLIVERGHRKVTSFKETAIATRACWIAASTLSALRLQ